MSSLLCLTTWPNNWPDASIPKTFVKSMYESCTEMDLELGLEDITDYVSWRRDETMFGSSSSL